MRMLRIAVQAFPLSKYLAKVLHMTSQRLIGFAICAGCGFLISALVMSTVSLIPYLQSVVRIAELLAGNPAPFAIFYTLGNILSLMGYCHMFESNPIVGQDFSSVWPYSSFIT